MGQKVETTPTVGVPPDGLVILIIGMRINKFWMVHRWIPSFTAMLSMLIELFKNKEKFGFLGAKPWMFSRTLLTIQYWESWDQLMAYAHDAQAGHHPKWRWFNRTVNNNGAVGIYHEAIEGARIHSVYRNMPPFGIARWCEAKPQRGVPTAGKVNRRSTLQDGAGHVHNGVVQDGLSYPEQTDKAA